MSPAMSYFPSRQFYDATLKDHPWTLQDNANGTRAKLRQLSLRHGVKGYNSRGSEYFLIDVKHGVSRIEVNGTSLVNHANADRIVALVTEMLDVGVQAPEIKILSYYQGQRRLLRRKIDETSWRKEIKDAIEVHTVDAFQGKESSVVIVDVVAARDNLMLNSRSKGRQPTQIQQEEEEEEENLMDNGTEAYVKLGAVTRHVRSPNRLNVALTRAMNGLVVVCQEALLVANPKHAAKRGKNYHAITSMTEDARHRRCHVEDTQTEDTHPRSVEMRAKFKTEDIEVDRQKQAAVDLGFFEDFKRMGWHKRDKKPNKSAQVPTYRTAKGRTTRPIGESRAVVAAEKHDREQERLAKEQEAMRLATSQSLGSAQEEKQLAMAKTLSESQKDKDFPPLPSGSR